MMERVGWWCLLGFALGLFTMTESVRALTTIDSSTEFYYEIGGGRAVSDSVTGSKSTELRASVYAGLSYSCGDFDLDENVKELFKNWEQMAEDLWDDLIRAFGGAVAALPAYMLQRANPGLYEVLTNAIARYEQIVQLSYRDCKDMEAMIARGENPYEDWIKVAKGEAWQRGVEEGKTATDTEDEIEEEVRKRGILWRDGKRCGGEETGACRVIEDVVRHGYDLLDVTSDSDADSLLRRYFASEDDAADWARAVLGGYEPSVYEGAPTTRIAGQGLSVVVYEVAEDVRKLLDKMVRKSTSAVRSAENYQLVSAPGVRITKSVLDALVDLHPTDRDLIIDRLASEIAAAQIMDRALTLRRIIRAGMTEAHMGNTQAAKFVTEAVLPELTEEIEALLLEKRVRQEFVTPTVTKLLERDRAIRATDMPRPGNRQRTPPLRNGVPTPTTPKAVSTE